MVDSLISLEGSGGWSAIGIMIFLPLIIGGFFIDFFTRVYFKNDVKKIWLYECIIIIVLVVVWLIQMGWGS